MELIVLIICGLLIISFLIDYIISVFFGHADFLLLREIISLLFSLDVQETCRLCLKFSNLSCLNRGILAIFMIQVNSNSHRSTSLRIYFCDCIQNWMFSNQDVFSRKCISYFFSPQLPSQKTYLLSYQVFKNSRRLLIHFVRMLDMFAK